MAFKCAIQVTGLVRGEPDGKHRSNGKAIMGEMGKERISSSETLNRALSSQNTYIGMSDSGFAIWDDMVQRAGEYKQPVKGKDRSGKEIIRYRGLRQNAVIGCAIIINPPYEECKNWTREEYDKFYEDSIEILHEMKPEIFREENRRLRAIHVDEGLETVPPQIFDEHMHEAYDCIDENGHYCGNEIDAKFLADLNRIYPAEMRKRGWEMEDLDVTDWEKYDHDSDYRKERITKAKNSGLSVNSHLHSKAIKNVEEANKIMMSAMDTASEQYKVTVEQEITRREQEKLQHQLEETARQQKEMQEKLERRDKNQRKVISYIKKIISELGGNVDNIKSYPDMIAALRAATDDFTEKAQEKARNLAEADLQQKEAALDEQEEQMVKQFREIMDLRKDYKTEIESVAKDMQDRHRQRTKDLESRYSGFMASKGYDFEDFDF